MALLILRRILVRFVRSILRLPGPRLAVVGLLLVLLGAGGYALVTRLSPGGGGVDLANASEVSVEGLEQNPSTGQILLVLKEKAGRRRLAMVVGDTEARTIFVELQGVRSERPLTYDLMRELITRLGARISHVIVNHVTESTFYAKVVVTTDGRQVEVDSRPSDAIALALRAKAPIFVDAQVLAKAGIASPN